MKKTVSFILAVLFSLCLTVPAMAVDENPMEPTQEISGNTLASELQDRAKVNLLGDTVLTLDIDKSIAWISCGDYSLTIEGTATLTIEAISGAKFILNSGKVVFSTDDDYSYFIPITAVDSITINGGELYMSNTPTGLSVYEDLNILGGKVEIRDTYAGISADVMNVSGGEVYSYGSFVGIAGVNSWQTDIRGCKLTVSGGYVEAAGIKTSDEYWTVGAALSGLSVTGGTLKMSGSLTAVNCWDTPVEIGGSAKIQSPAGAYASAEMTDTEHSDYGWSGYSIQNANGSRAIEVLISGNTESPALSVTVNGNAVQWTDAEPFIDENGRTMVPLRAVGDALGLTVDWDNTLREATFTNGTKTIYFPIDSTTARTSDGQSIQMDTAAVIVNDRTYAPVRYLAEFFGFTVGWDGTTRTVSIT